MADNDDDEATTIITGNIKGIRGEIKTTRGKNICSKSGQN